LVLWEKRWKEEKKKIGENWGGGGTVPSKKGRIKVGCENGVQKKKRQKLHRGNQGGGPKKEPPPKKKRPPAAKNKETPQEKTRPKHYQSLQPKKGLEIGTTQVKKKRKTPGEGTTPKKSPTVVGEGDQKIRKWLKPGEKRGGNFVALDEQKGVSLGLGGQQKKAGSKGHKPKKKRKQFTQG